MTGAAEKIIIQIASFLNVNLSTFMCLFLGLAQKLILKL